MQPIASLGIGHTSTRATGATTLSKLTGVVFLAMGALLTGATVANAQLRSGERQRGKTIIEPAYYDSTGGLTGQQRHVDHGLLQPPVGRCVQPGHADPARFPVTGANPPAPSPCRLERSAGS